MTGNELVSFAAPRFTRGSPISRQATLILIALAAVLALGACGRRARVVIDPRTGQSVLVDPRNERYTRQLIAYAARDSGCAAPALTPVQIHPEVYSVTGCVIPYEYWLQCSSRGRCRWHRVPTLNEAAATMTSCPPEMIQQSPTQDPMVRQAMGCGQSSIFAMQCSAAGMGCGWVLRGGAPTQPIVVQQGQMPPPQPQVLVVPQPPPAQPPPAQPPPAQPPPAPAQPTVQVQAALHLEAQIRSQREALLSCVQSGPINLTLRWSSDGQVILQMPPGLAGTPAEGCIHAVVGSLRVQAASPGQTVVAVQ